MTMQTPASDSFQCEARLFADGRTWCGRCDCVADDPAKLKCKPASECGLTLGVILEALSDEALRIDASNDAAAKLAQQKIAEGVNVQPGPYRERLRRVAALRAAVRAIEHYAGKGKGNG